jgi:glycosyltransferase involved in cell wall biosynthesis
MKIILANYRYFQSGGPERYMFNVTDALVKRGHEVIPFSIKYNKNITTPYSRYFVEPLGSRDEITFKEHGKSLKTMGRTLQRLFYANDVYRAIKDIVVDTQPQIAYVLHYLRKLSPSLLVGLKKSAVPIVVRLSDYGMLCPEAHCSRDGAICELCLSGNLWPSIAHRCVQGSLIASCINAMATWFHRYKCYFDLIDIFVTTNKFMMEKMLQFGIPKQRLRYIPTLVNNEVFKPCAADEKRNYIIWVGRLQRIKGVHLLIEAINIIYKESYNTGFKVKIVGSGDEVYKSYLFNLINKYRLEHIIEFVGELDSSEIAKLLAKAHISVVPSILYENLPNTILESFACGTPVIASDLGTLAETIEEGETGYLFKPGDAVNLAEKIKYCLGQPEECLRMGLKARKCAEATYSYENHLNLLENLFYELVPRS